MPASPWGTSTRARAVQARGRLALAQAYPGLTIVFAHLGGGLFLYETMPEVRNVLAGVYYDTAAVPYLYCRRSL